MKREREKHITRLHIILFFLVVIVLVIVLLSFKNRNSNSDDKYIEFESEIVRATQTYVNKLNKITITNGKETKLDINLLKKSALLQNDLADKCEGYVIINNQKNIDGEYETTYEAYISCTGGYMTPGYIEEY
ncbi:MAG: hypothetical protein IKF36_05120 [Bacilli bacterium]|nr:hypothetical protein [Bacilli bacterium]